MVGSGGKNNIRRLKTLENVLKNKKYSKETNDKVLTEKSMFFLSWLTARGSGTGSVCLMTETDSPKHC